MISQADKVVQITKGEIKEIVSEGVDEGVNKAFTRLGVDVSNPLEMQRDFQYVRNSRTFLQSIKTKAVSTAVVVIVTAFLGYVALGMNVANKIDTHGLTQDELGRAIVEYANKKQ